MKLLGAVLALLFVVSSQGQIVFTGDVLKDFTSSVPRIVRAGDTADTPDVGVPTQIGPTGTVISGWDIEAIYFQFDTARDELNIGVNCWEICGDADTIDHDPSGTSPQLQSIGGQDNADLSGQESFAVLVDLNLDVPANMGSGPYDYIIGVPAGDPVIGAPLSGSGCSDFSMAQCFGIYQYLDMAAVAPAFRFLSKTNFPILNRNPNPSLARPDFEWTITAFTTLRQSTVPPTNWKKDNREPWTMYIQGFAGSFVDAGVGEDYVPSQTNYNIVRFPCAFYDACDVCVGDGTTCLDCKAIPNGPNKYDACDVCGGDGSTCRDCKGIANGPNKYDVCDVCAGNGTTCLDCRGIVNGPNKYDACDVCGGDGRSCLDCRGIANGPNKYDVCDVCGGDGRSCLDCSGVPNGPNKYDVCDVCAGNGRSCLDCRGIANGPNKYDVCDVCAGDGSICQDCKGVPNGRAIYDVCDVCGGNGRSCLDCSGQPNGPAVYDVCDVCGGFGTSCLDCKGMANGASTYDVCDVCGGNGRSCLDCKGVPNGPAFYDICDVCGGNGKSCLDCSGQPNGPAVYDECDVCGGMDSTCSDCKGVPNGPAKYDVCDVCMGDGKSCADCAGVANGKAVYDLCDVCGGDGQRCKDCAGIPNGPTKYDVCHVCGGDGTSCLDCEGVPFGGKTYDFCDVCGGDGTSCVCSKIHGCPVGEIDHALLEWSMYAIREKIYHTQELLRGIKEELCRYDVDEGVLTEEIAAYLDTATDFREILDNFAYVNLWFNGAIQRDPTLIALMPNVHVPGSAQ